MFSYNKYYNYSQSILSIMGKPDAADNAALNEMGITATKSQNFSDWYQQVITKGKMIEYYDISGCYVLLPNAYGMWENIQKYLDYEFKSRGVDNVYFPLLITKKNLQREQDHIADFSPEVAWVTKTGSTDLTVKQEPGSQVDPEQNYLAIRPTSECGIYSVLPNLIKSYNDLPLKYNQWCNVLRWEFKDPTPFIRSREFLWNEGHTCFSNKEDAVAEVGDIIELYRKVYEKVLCVPVIKGVKTEKEKFAGAELTFTVETFIKETGKGIQCATAHHLGQKFSKMFDIVFQDSDGVNKHVYQNSWGFTTRSIGVTLMVHGDDKGAVIPPFVAPCQIVIVPITFKDKKEGFDEYVTDVYNSLSPYYRVKIDKSNHRPGWKFNFWETRGVPIRIEIGPKDMEKNVVTVCRRDTFQKVPVNFNAASMNHDIEKIMAEMEQNLYDVASAKLNDSIKRPKTWAAFIDGIEEKKMCLIPWCNDRKCEEAIKEELAVKSLCVPVDPKYMIEGVTERLCVKCSSKAVTGCLFGKSY